MVFAASIIVLLYTWKATLEGISGFMFEFNKIFPNVASSFLYAVVTLIGVFVGWFLSNRTEKKKLKVSEIRNELEKAYGPVYNIVSKPEKMVKVNEGNELRVAISGEEKKELDGILISYPHMFPRKIVASWRAEIRNLKPFETLKWYGGWEDFFGIPVEFKEEIIEEYEQMLKEYYKLTGREKRGA